MKAFDLNEFKKQCGLDKVDEHRAVLNKRAETIRQRIWKQETFKASNIENYVVDAYSIDTKSPMQLLKKYGLTDQYNTDQYSENYLEEIKTHK